jgi:DNA-binding response OmpR family regulator
MLTVGTNRRSVLLVEDDPSLHRMLAKHLTLEGFDVIAAVDYRSAVLALSQRTPDIVCLDLTLPRESGYELCEYIRSAAKMSALPIIVLSESSSPEDMAHAEHVGANAYLKKPFTVERLSKYVSTLLDGPHASRPSVRRLRRG